jgi:FAD/FMN-containing dehydrogenase/Fe-S oxidoreductase
MNIQNDLLNKILYSTDASAYREEPVGVYYPTNEDDLLEIVRYANENQIPLIPRAAGTSLAGQVVGKGLIVDTSRYMNRILEINAAEKWVKVQPGVVLDVLNKTLEPYRLFFGPETSTSNRCCIGGMVGNNSCGAHSLIYGSTRDKLLEARVVLSDGSLANFNELTNDEIIRKMTADNLESKIYRFVHAICSDQNLKNQIQEQYPDKKLRRRNTGYAIDELFLGDNVNLCSILAGSEGTLALISEVKLQLDFLPPAFNGLLCAHCNSLENVFSANLIALNHKPGAIELMDDKILELSKSNILQNKNRFFLKGDPAALLIVEFTYDTIDELNKAIDDLETELMSSGLVYHCSKVFGKDIASVWALRKAGLGLLATMVGDAKPVSLIEDTAVSPEKLSDYIKDITEMLDRHHLSCVYHGHISTGELHLRPILNLKDANDIELFRIVAHETALIVKKYRGSLSGEHGDGRLRGEFIPLMFGDEIYKLFIDLKNTFDPKHLLNPNKIVNTPPMNTSLRFSGENVQPEIKTFFNFNSQGGFIRAIEQCNGSGDCRKSVLLGGTMCPSYRATGDEKETTRARANVLRELLTYPRNRAIFDQKEIYEVLDLCLSCKGCKSECPSNVDMARYKAEFLQHWYLNNRPQLRTVLVSRMYEIQKMGSQFSGLYNFFATNHLTSKLLKSLLRFSPKRTIPQISNQFTQFYRQLNDRNYKFSVFLFADEFTTYNDAKVGIAFIELMNKLGYKVVIPKHTESGRAAISKGMIKHAKEISNKNVRLLKDVVKYDSPLVGIEPSCLLTFRDEYPDLVEHELRDTAFELSRNCLLYDEFIIGEYKRGRIKREQFTDNYLQIKLHGHCHQKSLASILPSKEMLSIPQNYQVDVIPSGCCGMAGSFGYEREHYDISMQIGEQVLFPMVRKSADQCVISAPGTSCRQQIKDGTGKTSFHPIEILYEALI